MGKIQIPTRTGRAQTPMTKTPPLLTPLIPAIRAELKSPRTCRDRLCVVNHLSQFFPAEEVFPILLNIITEKDFVLPLSETHRQDILAWGTQISLRDTVQAVTDRVFLNPHQSGFLIGILPDLLDQSILVPLDSALDEPTQAGLSSLEEETEQVLVGLASWIRLRWDRLTETPSLVEPLAELVQYLVSQMREFPEDLRTLCEGGPESVQAELIRFTKQAVLRYGERIEALESDYARGSGPDQERAKQVLISLLQRGENLPEVIRILATVTEPDPFLCRTAQVFLENKDLSSQAGLLYLATMSDADRKIAWPDMYREDPEILI